MSNSSQSEFYKFTSEYLKHITTLSTGSIVLITTFLNNIFRYPRWTAFVIVALVGFILSVIASVVAYTLLVHAYRRSLAKSTVASCPLNILLGSTYLTWIGFLVGMISLTIFAVKNLL